MADILTSKEQGDLLIQQWAVVAKCEQRLKTAKESLRRAKARLKRIEKTYAALVEAEWKSLR